VEVMHQRVIINITNKAKKHTHTKHKNQGPCETMYGIVSVSDFRCAVEMVYTYAASSKVIVTVLHNTTIPVICFHLQFQKKLISCAECHHQIQPAYHRFGKTSDGLTIDRRSCRSPSRNPVEEATMADLHRESSPTSQSRLDSFCTETRQLLIPPEIITKVVITRGTWYHWAVELVQEIGRRAH